MTTFIYIALAFAVGFSLGRYRSHTFQNRGEALVSQALQANFNSPGFHLLNHVTLKLNSGTTQIDQILVSRFGVFVIETKDYKGWIFANAMQPKWTQVLFRCKFRFQNPIIQNHLHVKAVRSLLDFLPPSSIKSAVIFTGHAEFKTDVPYGVFSLSGFIEHLQNSTEEIISMNRVQFAVGRLETARLAISRETDLNHIENVRRRHGDSS